ncbi:MAG: hypothetical protein A3G75_04650 [Verrucomicrobia bacterium RIFCSPLOWO2_12_FULL_64_8]|nr:MAG: hypothetical protein A3G75_04650 [Verrucomicrobia bacterium RIFCSPLOWO2_12_FULL_64_8]
MAEPGTHDYESHLSMPAAGFIASLPRRQQQKVLDLVEQIGRHPFQIGDYRMRDASGREVENLLIEGFLFTYWVDHAAKEVRISEIIRL